MSIKKFFPKLIIPAVIMMVVFMFGDMGSAISKISVFHAIFYPDDRFVQLIMPTVRRAVNAAIYGWAYVLCPPIASIPVISYYCDSRVSGFGDFMENRAGKMKYVALLFFSAFICAFLVTLLSCVFYVIICFIRFPINEIVPEGMTIQISGEKETVIEILWSAIVQFFAFSVYTGFFSICGMTVAFLYPKRYFILCIMFIVGYFINFVAYLNEWKAILLLAIIMIPSATFIIESSRGGLIKI